LFCSSLDLALLALELVGLLADAVEHVQVVVQDRRGLLQRVVRRDAAVRPDLEDQLVVVRDLPDAGVLDGVLDEPHGGEEGVDRDDADRLLLLLVLLARAVAAAGLDLDLGLERALAVERADDLVGIDDLDVGVGLDVAGRDGAGLGRLDAERDGLALVGDDEDLLRLSTISVTSSTTPSMLWNSWFTPSIFIDEMAAPSMELRRTLRSELPTVWP